MHIYILDPKLLQWSFLQISQLSIQSGAHKLFRRFLTFRNFWPQFRENCGATWQRIWELCVHLKDQSIVKKSAENRIKIDL